MTTIAYIRRNALRSLIPPPLWWLVSPYTGWRWAKWPTGEIGWVPDGVVLPDVLRVSSRNATR